MFCSVLIFAQTNPASNEQKSESSASSSVDADKGPWPVGPIYKVGAGAGVSEPRPMFTPDPEYSEEARRQRCGGTLVLWLIVGPDGKPYGTKVARPLGLGLDEKAIETVNKWRFEPAVKDGKPVAVQINVEVSFRLKEMNHAEADVLGDTMGANFSLYRAAVLRDVHTHWCKLIPEEARLKKGEVTVQFDVLKDGQRTDMQITSGSGDAVLDQAALSGITASTLRALPPEFKGNSIGLRMRFLYNSERMTTRRPDSSH
jgi:TonB family protein